MFNQTTTLQVPVVMLYINDRQINFPRRRAVWQASISTDSPGGRTGGRWWKEILNLPLIIVAPSPTLWESLLDLRRTVDFESDVTELDRNVSSLFCFPQKYGTKAPVKTCVHILGISLSTKLEAVSGILPVSPKEQISRGQIPVVWYLGWSYAFRVGEPCLVWFGTATRVSDKL